VAETLAPGKPYELKPVTPYRLDLTVCALRRLSTNIVDVLGPQGQYIRAFGGLRDPLVVNVVQTRPDAVSIRIEGPETEQATALALVRRMLGFDRDLSCFGLVAGSFPWLAQLAGRMKGVKPPRYPSLWEACVNAIVFQQVSLSAASSISRRLIMELSAPIEREAHRLYTFPSAENFMDASEETLRSAGLSSSKSAALRRVAEALLSGSLDEATLEELSSPEAAKLLCRIKGIGPWTATVILLRGLGRLDVFPMNDSSVARNLAMVAGSPQIDLKRLLEELGDQRGMLYYHLLLARLDARGELGRTSSWVSGSAWSR
jgi:DNA-3-methyladenine glycosylase II